jgi:diguanylate cyclase (GGDEF)-like protein
VRYGARLALGLGLGAISCAGAIEPSQPGPPAEPASTLEWRAFRSFTSADGLPQNSVLALAQDSEGYVYAGTHHGLARYDGREWRAVELPTGERSYAVGALAQTRDGALWIGTDEAGAWRIARGAAAAVPLPGRSDAINAFWEAPDGRLWIAASEGLFRCAATQCERLDALGQAGARSLFGEQRDGAWRLWVGSNTEGAIELLDLDAPQPRRSGLRIARGEGLPNNVALSIARFAGDLWIGSGRGLARFDGTRVHTYGTGNGFPNAMVFALLPDVDAEGRPLLLAALRPDGLAEIRPDGRWRVLDSQHGLPSNAVHSLLRERHRGALWIGTMSAGIARVERHHWALFDERMGLPDRIVLGVGWSAPRRELWVGTASGGARWGDGSFVPLLPPSHNAQLIYDLVDWPDGTRWIAHNRGLQRWRGESLELDYSVDTSALPAVSADRLALRRTAAGPELYIGTGHGLGRWREHDGLQRVTDLPGGASDQGIRSFATVPEAGDDAHDVLWMSDDLGLARLDRDGWTRPAPACVDRVAVFGLAAERDAQGETVWLATRSGLRRLGADGACVAYPATRVLGALTHVRMVRDAVYVFGARGAMRLQRDAPPEQAGRLYDAQAGLVSPEIGASALDDRGRLFGATAAGLAALQPDARDAITTPAPLRLVGAHFGLAQTPLRPGAVLPPNDSSVRFDYSLFAFDRERQARYRVRLHGLDEDYGAWSADASVAYPRLPPGQYRLQVQARDADGVRAAALGFVFSVAAPWWQRPWAIATAALALLALGLALGRWRLRAAGRRAAELEAEVAERTRELAAANARLEQAAVTDPLTGLKNRRYFALAAAAEAEHARRAAPERALLVALLDIDHFKRINDAYGHEAGDAVLVEVARRLQHVARGGDFVLRWGGEEFLLLLRDVERSAAPALLLRLLQELAQSAVETGSARIGLTASIGAIAFPPEPGTPSATTLEQAIARADAALYRAKREGRDRAALIEARGEGEPRCQMLLRIDSNASTPSSS